MDGGPRRFVSHRDLCDVAAHAHVLARSERKLLCPCAWRTPCDSCNHGTDWGTYNCGIADELSCVDKINLNMCRVAPRCLRGLPQISCFIYVCRWLRTAL